MEDDDEFMMLDIGGAIRRLKRGEKITRFTWTQTMRNPFLILVPGTDRVLTNPGTPYHNAGMDRATTEPRMDLITEGDKVVVGWTPSSEDVMAEDWCVVP